MYSTRVAYFQFVILVELKCFIGILNVGNSKGKREAGGRIRKVGKAAFEDVRFAKSEQGEARFYLGIRLRIFAISIPIKPTLNRDRNLCRQFKTCKFVKVVKMQPSNSKLPKIHKNARKPQNIANNHLKFIILGGYLVL